MVLKNFPSRSLYDAMDIHTVKFDFFWGQVKLFLKVSILVFGLGLFQVATVSYKVNFA